MTHLIMHWYFTLSYSFFSFSLSFVYSYRWGTVMARWTSQSSYRSPYWIRSLHHHVFGMSNLLWYDILMTTLSIQTLLFVGVSAAYHSWRENRPQGDSYYQGGGVGTTGYTGTTGTTPHTSSAGYNSSTYNASSFEPSADTLPRGTKMPRHPMSDTSVNEDSIAVDPSEATSTF